MRVCNACLSAGEFSDGEDACRRRTTHRRAGAHGGAKRRVIGAHGDKIARRMAACNNRINRRGWTACSRPRTMSETFATWMLGLSGDIMGGDIMGGDIVGGDIVGGDIMGEPAPIETEGHHLRRIKPGASRRSGRKQHNLQDKRVPGQGQKPQPPYRHTKWPRALHSL